MTICIRYISLLFALYLLGNAQGMLVSYFDLYNVVFVLIVSTYLELKCYFEIFLIIAIKPVSNYTTFLKCECLSSLR